MKIVTEGFRDYVQLPTGDTYNLGSVSVLELVTELARSTYEARAALDTFLETNQATLAVEVDDLVTLLTPRRAIWGHETQEHVMNLEKVGRILDQLQARVDQQLGGKVASDGGDLLALAGEIGRIADEEVRGCLTKEAKSDPALKKELELFIDNSPALDAQRTRILKAQTKLLEAGDYTPKAGQDLWEPLVDAGAKAYTKEFDEDPKLFPAALCAELAKDLAEDAKKGLASGELRVASEEESEPAVGEGGEVRQASEVEEALTQTVLARLERALSLVEKSDTRTASVAKMDIHRIASMLETCLEDGSGMDVTATLSDLATKVERIVNHFEQTNQ